MSPVRIAILGGAMVAALGAAFVVRGIASGHQAPAAAPVAQKPTVKVLVAARDLTMGDRLVEQDMSWQPWPAEGINPAYTVTGAPAAAATGQGAQLANAAGGVAAAMTGADRAPMQAFVGNTVREAIAKGEPLIASKLVKAGDAGVMAVGLAPGFRAMSVPLTAESAAGGFILPGDHVDVVQTHPMDGPNGKGFASATVLKNVKVLAVDQKIHEQAKGAQGGAAPPPAIVGATATLEVSPTQAELLARVKQGGQLTLVLRSYADIAGGATVGEVDAAATRQPTVRVFRDGKPTDVAVSR